MFVEGVEGPSFPMGLRIDFICEFDENDRQSRAQEPGVPVDDWSYVYLGYVIENESQLRHFADAYQRIIVDGGDFTRDLYVGTGNGNCGGDTLYRLRSPDRLVEILPCLQNRLNEIPVAIEWPGNHRGPIAKVFTLDPISRGEKFSYPSMWPMTENVIRILRELDAMGLAESGG